VAVAGATVAEALGGAPQRMAPPAVRRAGSFEAGALTHAHASAGHVTGGVRTLLRLEGLTVLAMAVAAYANFGDGWGLFAVLFLLPDLAFFGYLAGPRAGAVAYNMTHSYVGPLGLLAAGVLGTMPLLLAVALIWLAHIGFDRALGYGLKYASGFRQTHLGTLGRVDPW
jgi:Domain of unknown function (DUF4260)